MSRRLAISLLLLACGLFYFVPLASHGLWIPDETRYAQISQEMLLSGNWVAPHFMGLRYFEKPAGGYWLIAACQALFGSTLFGVRFASALSMTLSVLLAYCVAGRLWNDPRRSFACALVFMSCGLVAGQAGYLNLDPQFALWANLSLVALWYALTATSTRARVGAWALLGLACGMGFLVKGFVALLLPVLVALPYMIWRKRFVELLRFGLIAVAVAGLVAVPWALAVNRLEPDFWRFFFWHENIRRFAGQDAQHAEPWWYYLPLIVVSCAPWMLLLPSAFNQAWRERVSPQLVFVLLWLVLPLAFFSLSRGKLPSYVLPCLLPLALLIGHAVVSRLEEGKARALRANGLFNLLIGVAGLIAVVALQIKRPIYDHEAVHLALAIIGITAWIIANALQAARPTSLWMAPAVGIGALLAVIPASLPNSIVYSKTPDTFIAEHAGELANSHTLLANDLGPASALAWHARQPLVGLYNTDGETQYGLAYPDVHDRAVSLGNVAQWMASARKGGSVGVVMRVKGDDELHEIDLLPKDGKRYEQGSMVILLYEQSP